MEKKGYWAGAWGEVRSLKRLTFAALLCALSIVVGGFYVTVGENLRVYFTFFITAVGCAVYGPVLGVLAAAVTDTLNYMLFPSGAYFPGYLLSEMLGALIYGLLLYRKKITVLRLFTAKFLVNYLVNVGLGSLWSQILFGKGYVYYLVKSLIKNSLLLPLEVMALAALFSLVLPVFSRMGLLPEHDKRELERLGISASGFLVFGLDCLIGAGCSLYYAARAASGGAVLLGLGIGLGAAGMLLLALGPVLRRRTKSSEESSGQGKRPRH